MMKKIIIFTLIICATISIVGCSIGTQGEAHWEICLGFRTKQINEKPAKVTFDFTAMDSITDLFKKSDDAKDK